MVGVFVIEDVFKSSSGSKEGCLVWCGVVGCGVVW